MPVDCELDGDRVAHIVGEVVGSSSLLAHMCMFELLRLLQGLGFVLQQRRPFEHSIAARAHVGIQATLRLEPFPTDGASKGQHGKQMWPDALGGHSNSKIHGVNSKITPYVTYSRRMADEQVAVSAA